MLEGKLVRLRPMEPEDAATFSRWDQDWEVQRLSSGGPSLSLGHSVAECLEWIKGLPQRKDYIVFMITDRDSGRPIGHVQLAFLDYKNRRADMGIEIAEKEYWGKGYGRDTVAVMLRLAFGELGLNRVGAGCYEFNPRAIRCLEASGFKREGIDRDAIFRDGRFWDDVRLSVLAEEYFATKQREEAAPPA